MEPAAPADPAATVFAEFCAAGLWPGVGRGLLGRMNAGGITRAADVTLDALAALPRMTMVRAERLHTAWLEAAPVFDTAQLLVPVGLPVRWARRLRDRFGDRVATEVALDPWAILVLREASVAQADALAAVISPGAGETDPRRLRALVGWAVRARADDGHTVVPAEEVVATIRPYGIGTPDGAQALAAARAGGTIVMVDDPAATSGAEPTTAVALADLAAAEGAIARHLTRLADGARQLVDPAAAIAAAGGLDQTQLAAVVAALTHGVSLLTGGPGTGKSATVAAVVRACDTADIPVALAAPTGRAAKRLAELAGDDAAMTIHRLLGARYWPGSGGSIFERDEQFPIEADMIVVDEASMVDVTLAAALLAAIPDGAHLLVVGDPAQLPSIGPGRVLGDVLDADRFPTTELTTLYRQSDGGAIARLATAVRGGELIGPDTDDHEVVIVPATSSQEAARRVVQLVTDSIPRVFDLSGEQIQVVTPIHRGPAGTGELNRALKAVLNPGAGTVRGFDVGDRVVATANHADAIPYGYANGEVGTVVSAARGRLRVAFTGGEADISGKALGELLHGWAITVHRAQGSEWEAVVAVLPPEAGRMLSRPLIYTALTRARRHLSVVHAAGPAVAHAVRHVGTRPRRTRLPQLLRGSG